MKVPVALVTAATAGLVPVKVKVSPVFITEVSVIAPVALVQVACVTDTAGVIGIVLTTIIEVVDVLEHPVVGSV